jgi:transcriptional regulator with XRE-family HTH domain
MNRNKGRNPSNTLHDEPAAPSLKPCIGNPREIACRTTAERVRGILATKGLSLYKLAALARLRYPRDPRYHIPRNFYFRLRSSGLTPTPFQLMAFCQLTGYRLADWFRVFDFRLEEIPALQATLERPRTGIIDATLDDPRALVPLFRELRRPAPLPPAAPLSQLLKLSGRTTLASLLPSNVSKYLYAKIGRRDALAFPDLLPGSIVRANPQFMLPVTREERARTRNNIFLIEHGRGHCCCRLHFGDIGRITLVPSQLAFASVQFQLGLEARILGMVDFEFRPLKNSSQTAIAGCTAPDVAPDLSRLWTPVPLNQRNTNRRTGTLLRDARRRAGLSLRHASELSRAVASAFQDSRYFTSQASLSDYEAGSMPPRHTHKLLTLCVIYSLYFYELLHFFGLRPDEHKMSAIADEWFEHQRKAPNDLALRKSNQPFLPMTFEKIGELPFFLRSALPPLSRLPKLSLHDVFWVGGQKKPLHPSLTGALLVFVERRKRRPRILRHKSHWEQPIFLLRKRDGSYVLASCSMEDNTIVVHPCTESFVTPERLQNRVDAEVIGQIMTIVRSLASPT